MVDTKDAYAPGAKRVAVTKVIVLAGLDDALMCGQDIALLQLATAIGARAYEPRLSAPPLEGTTFTASGYGYDGLRKGDGIRRSRSGLKVGRVGAKKEGSVPVQTATEWDTDIGPCQGDSGGSAISDDDTLIGVVSRGAPDCTSQRFTRLDSYAEWLRTSVREATANGSVPTPAWAIAKTAAPASADENPKSVREPAPQAEETSSSCSTRRGGHTHHPAAALLAIVAGALMLRRRPRARR